MAILAAIPNAAGACSGSSSDDQVISADAAPEANVADAPVGDGDAAASDSGANDSSAAGSGGDGVADASGGGGAGASGDSAGGTGGDGAADVWDGGGPSCPAKDNEAISLYVESDTALQGMLLEFWNGHDQYLNQGSPSDSKLTWWWTFAQAWEAVIDGVTKTHGSHYGGLIETFWIAQDEKGWLNDFYDDENWLTLALIRSYDLDGTPKYLQKAEDIYSDIMNGWDPACCGSFCGGIWWDKTPDPGTGRRTKATASNAGPVIAGVRLAARTGNPSYLSFAHKVFEFWASSMLDPGTHHVLDHFDDAGNVVDWQFTYNEGLMIGAAVELYQATSQPAYLDTARAIASYLVQHETRAAPAGQVLFDQDNAHSDATNAQFKGIAFRYLAQLAAVDAPNSQVCDVLSASAHAAWDNARDATTNLFGPNWLEPPAAPFFVSASSSASSALAVYTELLGGYFVPLAANLFEAEDSVLHHLGLEASHPGFGGWGYVAGWNGDGQWIDFKVSGHLGDQLTFRYSAGAGDATRLIFINGAQAFPNQTFASTGSWDTYADMTVQVPLQSGVNTVSVIYNSSLGSSNYLNLDWLSITP